MNMQKDGVTSTLISQFLPTTLPPPAILLKPNLWFNPASATIIHQGKGILLTKRENDLLKILLKPPRPWHTASSLARKLRRHSVVPIEAHSIEQTICGLRRKLGENGKHQRILQSHYGHGYRLVLADPSPE